MFDQREPVPGKYDSICTFSGGWQQSFAVPPGGVGQFTVSLRILGGSTALSQCVWSPCGCTTPSPQLLINGVDQVGFFTDPGCAHITEWSKTFQGADAAIGAGGTLNFEVHWNDQPFALDWSKVTDVLPIINMQLLDGDAQKGVIANAVENKLRVQLSCADPAFPVEGMKVTFTVTNHPPRATKYAVGTDDKATTTTYAATADANGIASAVLVLGDMEGSYTVQATAPLNLSGGVTFTATAQKPDSTAILKDSTDVADRADTYAVPSDQPTQLFAVGLDKAGQKIGPIKCNWTTASSGNGATRGGGSVAPTADTSSTKFTPSQVGHLTVSANPPISGIPTGKADLFLTKPYVEVEGFDPNNPVDQLDQFVPGSLLDGSSVAPTQMIAGSPFPGQPVKLHVLTGPGSKGSVQFSILNPSSYPGIAMNYPMGSSDTSPDLDFGNSPSTTVQFASSGDTVATVYVRDYAANGSVHVTITSGRKTYVLKDIQLPIDNDGNNVADHGWRAENATVPDTGLDAGKDEDNTPVMSVAMPNDGRGTTGDNLTNFEEYRGFVFRSVHRRTNPFHKDYFVNGTAFGYDIGSAFPALPTSTYSIDSIDATATGVINPNHAGLPGDTAAAPNGHVDVKAHLLVKDPVYNPDFLGDTFCGGKGPDEAWTPNDCTESIIFAGTIQYDTDHFGGGDPAKYLDLQHNTVAHECGHSVNLYHNDSTDCLMYGGGFTAQGGFSNLPQEFCTGVDTVVHCDSCGLPYPYDVPVTGFDETSTLRIKK